MESDEPLRSCTNCGKPQAELPNPLKQCARCHTQAYCSRDCQKNHWKNHKKDCSSSTRSSTRPPPPSEETILKHVDETVRLMKALCKLPDFRQDLTSIPPHAAGLKHLADFVARTFREYWCRMLPLKIWMDLAVDLEAFHGMERTAHTQDLERQVEQVKSVDPSFSEHSWPPFSREGYGDGLSRNYMAARIIREPELQAMMGGIYDYSQEVKDIGREILPPRDMTATPSQTPSES